MILVGTNPTNNSFKTLSHVLSGRVEILESLVHYLDLKELNELRTRIVFFLKLDKREVPPRLWVPLNSRLMTSSVHVA